MQELNGSNVNDIIGTNDIATANKIVGKKDKAGENKATKTNKKVEVKQAYMYLGPNIPGGILFRGSVVKGGTPEDLAHLKDVFSKIPEVKDLFVEVKQVPQFKADIENQGTEAHRLYQNVEVLIREGALKNV